MGRINVLDKHVAELIAAGEVVERPSSVIKELVENSIDAGAKSITIEIKNGGVTYMRITDDGIGIEKDDIRNAFLRNATSKIKIEDDLNNISTLGFRGEALFSICAVSRVELITRTSIQETGIFYKIEGGEEVLFEECGCSVGTTIIVRDLFYNTPARMKFLKKDMSEGSSIAKILDRIALSHPEISFKFIRENKMELNTPGNGQISSAIYSVYGKEFFSSLIAVDYKLNGIKVRGFVSNPTIPRSSRNMQHFFINGRYVKSKTAMVALEEAFKGSIMVQKFPACVMYIDLPLDTIDVNVHPSKVEIRFIDERPIFDAIYHGVKTALFNNDSPVLSIKDTVFVNEKIYDSGNDVKKENKITNLINNDNIVDAKEKIFNATVNNLKNEVCKEDIEPEVFIPKNIENSYAKKSDFTGEFNNEQKYFDVNNSFEKNIKQEVSSLKSSELFEKTRVENDYAQKSFGVDNSIEKNIKQEVSSLKSSELFEKTRVENDYAQKSFDVDNSIEKNIRNDVSSLKSSELFEKTNVKEVEQIKFSSEDFNEKIKGEIFNTYIIVEKNNEELILIDKHAAHERIIYEKLKSETESPAQQLFLEPIVISLSKDEHNAIIENINLFFNAGFEIDDFGNGAVIVRAAPTYLENIYVVEIITQMANYILEHRKNVNSDYVEWLYENIACRAAIKAGKEAKQEEIYSLVKQIIKEEPRFCPHGRPVAITLKKREIEKRFGRV